MDRNVHNLVPVGVEVTAESNGPGLHNTRKHDTSVRVGLADLLQVTQVIRMLEVEAHDTDRINIACTARNATQGHGLPLQRQLRAATLGSTDLKPVLTSLVHLD